MALRQAYAGALQFIRARMGLSQLDLADARTASYISRLEAAKSSVTVQASDDLAKAMSLHPLSLLTLTYAAREQCSPKDVLERVSAELEALAMLDSTIPVDTGRLAHPQMAKGLKTTRAVHALKNAGHSQAEVARLLDISPATVTRHWYRPED